MLFNSTAVNKYVENQKVSDFDFSKFFMLRTTFQFDDLYTFKILCRGSNPKKYYKHVSCIDYIESVDVPMLFLHSRNDPICL